MCFCCEIDECPHKVPSQLLMCRMEHLEVSSCSLKWLGYPHQKCPFGRGRLLLLHREIEWSRGYLALLQRENRAHLKWYCGKLWDDEMTRQQTVSHGLMNQIVRGRRKFVFFFFCRVILGNSNRREKFLNLNSRQISDFNESEGMSGRNNSSNYRDLRSQREKMRHLCTKIWETRGQRKPSGRW